MMDPLVLSVGTTHPRNLAGLGLDARIAAECGVVHAIAVAGVSAQDATGVHALFPIPAGVLRAQLKSIALRDVAAVRIGALASVENATVVAEFFADFAAPLVFDPVMRASAGGSLYDGDALQAVRAVIQRAKPIVTPNIEEAQLLCEREIRGVDDMIAAGRQLLDMGARSAVVKGGHLPGEPVDVLVTRAGAEQFSDVRLPGKTHGTGCMLAMTLACALARNEKLLDAVKGARAYVRANIARA